MEIVIESITDCSILKNFYCGIKQMDSFIHNRLQTSVDNHYCKTYIARTQTDIIAFFALSFDSIEFSGDDMEELFAGVPIGDIPNVTNDYKEDFKSKLHHPALEITFLAVNKDFQKQGIGKDIVEEIAKKAIEQDFAGCEFLTVGALCTKEYSAVNFYNKCHFATYELAKQGKDTVRMYRILYYNSLSV